MAHYSAIALCGFRLLRIRWQKLRQSGRLTKNIAIVGASEIGHQLAAKFIQERLGTRLVGLFDERRSRFVQSGNGSTAVYQLEALYELLCKGCVDEVVIAIPPSASYRILELSRHFHPFAVSLRVLAPEGTRISRCWTVVGTATLVPSGEGNRSTRWPLVKRTRTW